MLWYQEPPRYWCAGKAFGVSPTIGTRRKALVEVFVVTQPDDGSTPNVARTAGVTPKAAGVAGSPQFSGWPGVAKSG